MAKNRKPTDNTIPLHVELMTQIFVYLDNGAKARGIYKREFLEDIIRHYVKLTEKRDLLAPDPKKFVQ